MTVTYTLEDLLLMQDAGIELPWAELSGSLLFHGFIRKYGSYEDQVRLADISGSGYFMPDWACAKMIQEMRLRGDFGKLQKTIAEAEQWKLQQLAKIPRWRRIEPAHQLSLFGPE